MRIVVNHLTRMKGGIICAAGIDLKTRKHVRPTAGEPLTAQRLSVYGGPFDIGAIVDIGDAHLIGEPPRVEDHSFDWWLAWKTGDVEPDRFWRMLLYVAKPSLALIFGEDLQRRGNGYAAVEPGHGCASLGCLAPPAPPRLHIVERPDRPPQVRVAVKDRGFDLDLPVTDVRLYQDDAPLAGRVAGVANRLEAGVETILAVGLTWPYAPKAGGPALHWLQVNNIHLKDSPAWRLDTG